MGDVLLSLFVIVIVGAYIVVAVYNFGKTYFAAVLQRRKERRSAKQMAGANNGGENDTGNRSVKVVPQNYVAAQNERHELKSWGK